MDWTDSHATATSDDELGCRVGTRIDFLTRSESFAHA